MRNGGHGVAIDVRGFVTWRDPQTGAEQHSLTLTATIAGDGLAQTPLMPPVGNWDGARGELRYFGVLRDEWLTRFEFVIADVGVGCQVTDVIDVTRPRLAV